MVVKLLLSHETGLAKIAIVRFDAGVNHFVFPANGELGQNFRIVLVEMLQQTLRQLSYK